AFGSTTAAWDADDLTPSLSFGYHALNESEALHKTVEVHNYRGNSRTYSIGTSFRYASDAASGAVAFDVPSSVTVAAHDSARFKVHLTTDATKLSVWTLNGGSRGGDGFRLQDVEFDGFITLSDGIDTIHLPWHILPHRAANVTPDTTAVHLQNGTANQRLSNGAAAVESRVEVFS